MKKNAITQRVPTRFGRETRFQLTPKVNSITRDQARSVFHELKTRLLRPILNEAAGASMRKQLRLAANEAAAVAWTTPFPLLALPLLLEEKTSEVQQYMVRQERLQDWGRVLLEASG